MSTPSSAVTLSDGAHTRPAVSVIVPLKDEEHTLAALHEQVVSVLDQAGKTFEIVFIDDGSRDGSVDVMRRLSADDMRVRVIRLRRNFGKSAALAVGFREARGRSVLTIDADLQDDPEEFPRLLARLAEGYDLVSGWKQRRQDRWTRRVASRLFNWMTRRVSKLPLHDFNCGLKAYSAECAQELAAFCRGELHRYLPVLAHARGFRVTEIPVRHRRRSNGRSRYGMERYFRGLLDLITTTFLHRYDRRPMHVFGLVGLLLFLPGTVSLGYLVFEKIFFGVGIGQRPLLILGAVLAITGLQLMLSGLLAELLIPRREAEAPYREEMVLHREGRLEDLEEQGQEREQQQEPLGAER